MKTGLERIAAKARSEPKLKFTSLCHHITPTLIGESLSHIPNKSAAGVDGIDVEEAKKTFNNWVTPMIRSIHHSGYKAPAVRRVWIPKPGKQEKRPLGVPCVSDRALQRSVSAVLSQIYEQDFLPCSFGGRAGKSAHNALATLHETVSMCRVNWVYEVDLKNFFGSLSHGRLLRFVEHRVGDPRIVNLIRRWLKAGVLDAGVTTTNEEGVSQGGSISVLLSNLYLHYVLDLWFTKVVKPRMRGEARLIRYIDDFIVCFEFKSDAERFQTALTRRLGKFSLKLEPDKTRLIEFGRSPYYRARKQGKKLKTVYFLGFTHYCTQSRRGKFLLGRRTEKSRFKRSVQSLQLLMQRIRHYKIRDQVKEINQVLRGHYAYYGLGGNHVSLRKLYKIVERYWHKMLCSRSRAGYITWEKFLKIKKRYPLREPRLSIAYAEMPQYAVL